VATRTRAKAANAANAEQTPETEGTTATFGDAVSADAPGAHADSAADRSDTPAPETGDDTEKGQAGPLHPGQVSPDTAVETGDELVSGGHAGYGVVNAATTLNPEGAVLEVPFEPLAPGAYRDAVPDADRPETGDDTDNGQPARQGQVAPLGEIQGIVGSDNLIGLDEKAPYLDEARGAHADAYDDSPSPVNGQDTAAGQPVRLGQVGVLDGAVPNFATAAAINIGTAVGPAPTAAQLEPPSQAVHALSTKQQRPRLADSGIALSEQQAGLIIDEATGETPDPEAMFKRLTENSDAQVAQVRLVQRGRFGLHPNEQLILAAGSVVSGVQAAVLKARAQRQALEV
jgi:hypothetical protein